MKRIKLISSLLIAVLLLSSCSGGKKPEKVEKQLRAILPPEESSDFCHRIVWFGRETCTARSPKCAECPLSDICKKGIGEIKK